MKITYWPFSETAVPKEKADALASKFEAGDLPSCTGLRLHKVGGWCFDIGRKPYLIEDAVDGRIYRCWAFGVGELRKTLGLRRSDKVIPDPF